jgi:hypothetical protein
MADLTINDLPTQTIALDTEMEVQLASGGASGKCTVEDIINAAPQTLPPGTVDGQVLRWDEDGSGWQPSSVVILEDSGVVVTQSAVRIGDPPNPDLSRLLIKQAVTQDGITVRSAGSDSYGINISTSFGAQMATIAAIEPTNDLFDGAQIRFDNFGRALSFWTAQTDGIPLQRLTLPRTGGANWNFGTVAQMDHTFARGYGIYTSADAQLFDSALASYLDLHTGIFAPDAANVFVLTGPVSSRQAFNFSNTGFLNLPQLVPTAPAHATSKQYVDDSVAPFAASIADLTNNLALLAGRVQTLEDTCVTVGPP